MDISHEYYGALGIAFSFFLPLKSSFRNELLGWNDKDLLLNSLALSIAFVDDIPYVRTVRSLMRLRIESFYVFQSLSTSRVNKQQQQEQGTESKILMCRDHEAKKEIPKESDWSSAWKMVKKRVHLSSDDCLHARLNHPCFHSADDNFICL